MVANNATNVIGLILGINLVVYHSSPLSFMSTNLVIIPAKNGIPK